MTEWKITCPNGHEIPLVDMLIYVFTTRMDNKIKFKCNECGEEREINIEVLLGV